MRLKLLIASILMITSSGFAQVATCNQSSIISNFGIDANVNANTSSINIDDWFQNNSFPGNGIGVIGAGASTATPSMSASTFGSLIQGAANGKSHQIQSI